MNIFGAIYMPFIGEMMEGKERTEKRKGELVQQFRNLKNLPRKKKKKEKERILLEYSIMDYGSKMFESMF
jgi:hypothetical protein